MGDGDGVAVGVGVGTGEGEGVGVSSATAVGETGAIDGETTATGAVAPGDALGPMLIAPPRASTNATDAVNAITSTTREPSMAGDIVLPSRTTGVGVSVMTAAPRR